MGEPVTGFIEIPRWDEFQHLDATKRGRDPIWIKTYTRLLSDDAYLGLTPVQRAVLHGVWLEYARSGQRLPADTEQLSRRLGLRVRTGTLEEIKQAGFIDFGELATRRRKRAVDTPLERRQDAVRTPLARPGDAVGSPIDQPEPHQQAETGAICHATVTPLSRLEEKREEKILKNPLHVEEKVVELDSRRETTATQPHDHTSAPLKTEVDLLLGRLHGRGAA